MSELSPLDRAFWRAYLQEGPIGERQADARHVDVMMAHLAQGGGEAKAAKLFAEYPVNQGIE